MCVVCVCSYSRWLPSPGCCLVVPGHCKVSQLGPVNGHLNTYFSGQCSSINRTYANISWRPTYTNVSQWTDRAKYVYYQKKHPDTEQQHACWNARTGKPSEDSFELVVSFQDTVPSKHCWEDQRVIQDTWWVFANRFLENPNSEDLQKKILLVACEWNSTCKYSMYWSILCFDPNHFL